MVENIDGVQSYRDFNNGETTYSIDVLTGKYFVIANMI
jgi:hypothetical protein